MSDDRDLSYVLDMVNAGQAIRRFVGTRTQDEFLRDDQLQSAVLYQFTILGQAARRISEAFRAAHASVDWAGIVSFRNRIVHEYDEVNLDKVWEIARLDLTSALTSLEPLVPKEPDGE